MIITRSEAILSAMAASLLAYAWGAGEAYPHDALPTATQPDGWRYGVECCSLMDCSRMDSSGIRETSQGFVVKLTGEVIPYGDPRVKQSKDEFFHRCTPGGNVDAKRSICLYVPSRGF